MTVAEKVKTYRLKKAWSQEQLAEVASLSVRTVQRTEKGQKPSLETLSANVVMMRDQFARAGDTPPPPKVGMVGQSSSFLGKQLIKREGSGRIFLCDVFSDPFPVRRLPYLSRPVS